MLAIRLTEQTLRKLPTMKDLLQLDLDGIYDLPVDALTDCRYLYELTVGTRGVAQDRTQRLLFVSLQNRTIIGKTCSTSWVNTYDMPATGCTKYQSSDLALIRLLDTRKLYT